MQEGLTPKQAKLLAYIKDRLAADKVAPSFREMGAHMNTNSMSAITAMLCQLKDRGHIAIPPHKARRIRVIEP